jgi:hypothetical protein
MLSYHGQHVDGDVGPIGSTFYLTDILAGDPGKVSQLLLAQPYLKAGSPQIKCQRSAPDRYGRRLRLGRTFSCGHPCFGDPHW